MVNILNLEALSGMDYKMCIGSVVIMIGTLGSNYAIFGGLKAVAVSDTFNGFGLLLAGIAISYFALNLASGGNGAVEDYAIVKEAIPEKFNSISNPDGDVSF